MRKAAVMAAVAALAAVVLVVVLPRVVPMDIFKSRIVSLMEEKTGRKVGFSGVSLSLFPGIGLKIEGLTVSGDPGHPEESLLSVPEAEIRLAIAPLLAGRAEFSKLSLRRPQVVFRSYRDGTHSATRISDRLARKEEPAPPVDRERVTFALDAVSVEDAKLLLFLEEDEAGETRWEISPVTIRLDGIGRTRKEFELSTRIGGALKGGIRLSGSADKGDKTAAGDVPVRFEARGEAFGQQLLAEGRISAPQGVTEVEVALTFPRIEMDRIPGMFASPPGWLSKASPEGEATASVRISGSAQALGFEAEADLTRAGWTVTPGVRKFIGAPCTVVAQGRRFPDLYALSNAELGFPPLLVIANASLVPSTGEREWNASARIASLSDLAKSRGGGLERWSPAGRLTASGKGRRAAADAKDDWNVALDIANVAFRLPDERIDMRDLDGHAEITPEAVRFLPLAGLFNGQRFSLRGTVSLGKKPAGQASLRMPYLDLDALLSPGEAGGEAKGKVVGVREKEKPGEEGRLEFSARGDVRIDAGKAHGLEFRDLEGSGRYEEGTLILESLKARLYGGEAAASGRIEIGKPGREFRLKAALKNVRAEEMLSRLTTMKDLLSGSASMSAELGGGSRTFDDFSRTAAGKGSLRVAGGKIRGVDLPSAAAGLSGLPASFFQAQAAPGGKGKVAETAFSDLSADFRIEGGKLRTDALRIASGKLRLSGAATLGFDRSFDFRGTLVLPREASERARGMGGRFLTGSSGQVEIPLRVSGQVTSPDVAIDAEVLAKGVAGGALRSIMDRASEAPSATEKAPSPGVPARPAPGRPLQRIMDMLMPGKK